MQKNESAIVKIEDIGVNGEGIGRVNGYTLFIKDAIIGDVAEVKATKLKKNYGYARLVRVIEPSPYRREALCPFARKCGGCQIQEMEYGRQLQFKEEKVKNNLLRIGGFSKEEIERVFHPILGMEDSYHYRNKAQFPFGKSKAGEIITGFYAGRTHDIIANTDCALGVPVNQEILEILLEFMKAEGLEPYDEKSGEGLLRHALLRYGFRSEEIMVCLVVNRAKPEKNGLWFPGQERLTERLSAIPGMTSITVSPNTRRSNVIMGETFHTLWGQDYITDFIGDIRYQISPLSFYQVNPVQTERLYQLAMEYAELQGGETVWDLYCGIGTISLFLAQKAKKVYGVEIIPQAIEDAKRNAALNGLQNVEFFVGKAEEIQEERFEGQMPPADVIVVDPPRKGCEESLLQTMTEIAPRKIVYVSCDSATLARDLKYLCSNGYELKKIRPVDQFPNTVHTEVCVLLMKSSEA